MKIAGGVRGKSFSPELLVNNEISSSGSKCSNDVVDNNFTTSNPSSKKKKSSNKQLVIRTNAEARDTEGFTFLSTPEVYASSISEPSSVAVSRNSSVDDNANKV